MNIHSPDITVQDLEDEINENPDRLEEVSFNGWTPLIAACNYGNLETAKWLLDHGADIHARDNYGGTCLHWACREGKEKMAELLVDYGADMEATTNVGATPLHVSCGGGGFYFPATTLESRINIAAMLVDRGANLEAKKMNGMTPLQFLESAAHKERLLEVAGTAQLRLQCNALAEAEAAALEECELRESVSAPCMSWADFTVDTSKTPRSGTPPIASRSLRLSSSSISLKGFSTPRSSLTGSKSTSQLSAMGGSTSSSSASEFKDTFLGRGTNSAIVRLIWQQAFGEEEVVAVKILSRSNFLHHAEFERARMELFHEADAAIQVLHRVIKNDSFVKVYGIVAGPISSPIARLIKVPVGDESVGLVMRCELGGSLQNCLHVRRSHAIDVPERMRLLALIVRGLAEMHLAGIVHCEVHSKNILLSHAGKNATPRFTGFGSVIHRQPAAMDDLFTSNNFSVYTAPELLGRLTGDSEDDVGLSIGFTPDHSSPTPVGSPSWRSDIYSFAILCWEVLTRQRPFDGEMMESRLAVAVQGGERPPLDDLFDLQTVDESVIRTIEKCWSEDKYERKSAVEFYVTLNHAYSMLSNEKFDLYISYCVDTSKPFICNTYHLLTKLGYRVWCGVNDERKQWDPLLMDASEPQSPCGDFQMYGGIGRSDIVLAFVNSSYQSQACCVTELHKAKLCNPPKRIVAVVTEPNPFQWASRELEQLCDLRGHLFIDLSSLSSKDWGAEDGSTSAMIIALNDSLQPLFAVLHETGCHPSRTSSVDCPSVDMSESDLNSSGNSCSMM